MMEKSLRSKPANGRISQLLPGLVCGGCMGSVSPDGEELMMTYSGSQDYGQQDLWLQHPLLKKYRRRVKGCLL